MLSFVRDSGQWLKHSAMDQRFHVQHGSARLNTTPVASQIKHFFYLPLEGQLLKVKGFGEVLLYSTTNNDLIKCKTKCFKKYLSGSLVELYSIKYFECFISFRLGLIHTLIVAI